MIIDFHTHLFPEEIRNDRERFFDGEPAFRLLYKSPSSRLAGQEVRRGLDGLLSGVGEIAFYDSGLDEKVLESLNSAMEVCKNRDMPVLIHVNEPVGHAYAGKTRGTVRRT